MISVVSERNVPIPADGLLRCVGDIPAMGVLLSDDRHLVDLRDGQVLLLRRRNDGIPAKYLHADLLDRLGTGCHGGEQLRLYILY